MGEMAAAAELASAFNHLSYKQRLELATYTAWQQTLDLATPALVGCTPSVDTQAQTPGIYVDCPLLRSSTAVFELGNLSCRTSATELPVH